MQKLLTVTVIEKTKSPDTGRLQIFDTAVSGLFLRIGARTRSFYVATRIHGNRANVSIGPAKIGDGPGLTLSEARTRAGEVIDQAAAGHDPRQTRKNEVAANKKRSENTFGAVADLYVKRYAKVQKRTWREDERILNKYFKPHWEDRPISAITKADVVDVLDEIEKGGIYMANRSLAVVRKLFNWAMDERALIDAVPIGRKMARGVEGARKRAFTDEEIKALWSATDKIGGVKGAAVKMLMLTGQRRGVVAGMKWSEINKGVWTIPGEETGRAKNKLDHIVPLPSQALDLLKSIPKVKGKDVIFGSVTKRGETAMNVGSKIKTEFDELCGFEDWVWNNLRGLVTTRMKRPLGVPDQIINLVQGRLDQSILAKNYDANDYLQDKRRALQTWANYLEAVIESQPDNLISLFRSE